jgi:hypothetical protein
LESYAIGDGFHVASNGIEFIHRLLNAAPRGRSRLHAMLEQINEWLTVVFTHTGDVEGDTIDLEFSLRLIVVKLRLVKCDEFQDDHGYGKNISLIDIILDIIFELIDKVELFWREDVVFYL